MAKGPKADVKIECNSLYKASDSVNIKLTPSQAIAIARGLLQKAQGIIDGNADREGIHLWSKGKQSEVLYCGWGALRKGPRTGKSNSN